MNPTKYLAGRLRRAIHGPMWHGPSVVEALAGFDARSAPAHPVPGAHSAWELVLHITTWAEIAMQRLDGEAMAMPPADVDWPAAPADASPDAWAAAQARLVAAYEALASRVATMPAESLLVPLQGLDHTVGVMLDGLIEHATYHGGQIAILRRALAADRRLPGRAR